MLRRALLASCFLLLPAISSAAGSTTEAAIVSLSAAASADAALTRSGITGTVTFFSAGAGSGLLVSDPNAVSPSDRALSFLATFGEAFGIRSTTDLQIKSTNTDELRMDHVRYQQLHQGIPVTGGELIVHLRGNRVLAANGKVVPDLEEISTTPAIGAEEATASTIELLRKHMHVDDADLSDPRLEVFNRGLLEDRATPTRLAWFIEATRIDLREYFWVDATTGTVLLHFSQLPEAKNRTIYNGNNSSSLPGTLMRSEGGPATGDGDADDAYTYSGVTYDYFLAQHGRDSFDGLGGELRSTVHNCPSPAECPLQNAFWNGTQMIYGEGYASSDDVVAHELTHAVTNYTADLFYYMQSGALNESFSDIFGETVDLIDSLGNDLPGVRWQLGEDLSGGAIRNLMNPPAFGQPARANDSNFQCPSGSFFDGDLDRGGVHTNSGVPNHGYALMVDGGTYNGRTIVGIGLTKAAKIQYRTLATYLVSASGFADTYSALNRSCTDLVGVAGISAADCIQVKNALDAVELAGTLPCSPAHSVAPSLCPTGQTAADLSLIDFETSIGFPVCPTNTAPTAWCDFTTGPFGGPYSTSGIHSLWGTTDRRRGTCPRPFLGTARCQLMQSFSSITHTVLKAIRMASTMAASSSTALTAAHLGLTPLHSSQLAQAIAGSWTIPMAILWQEEAPS
jgi:bacillolysin